MKLDKNDLVLMVIATAILLTVCYCQSVQPKVSRDSREALVDSQNQEFHRVIDADNKYIEEQKKPGDPDGPAFTFCDNMWTVHPRNVNAILDSHKSRIKFLEGRIFHLEKMAIPTTNVGVIAWPRIDPKPEKRDTIIPAGD